MIKMRFSITTAFLFIAFIFTSRVSHAQATTSSAEGAKFLFRETVHDFGKITKDTAVDYRFEFTNSGTASLTIYSASLSCQCFTVNWERRAVMPGQKGWIDVHYPVNGHIEPFDKLIWLTSNVVNNNPDLGSFELRIKGNTEAVRPVAAPRKKRRRQ